MVKTKKQPSINTLMQQAGRIGHLLEGVVAKCGQYDKRIHGRSTTILSIYTALELIAKTPNATINRDALDEWASQVRKARRDLESWMKDHLKSGGKRGDDLSDEEIPF